MAFIRYVSFHFDELRYYSSNLVERIHFTVSMFYSG